MMDFDLILDYLGHFGKFQCCVMLLAGIAQIFGGMQTHSSNFVIFGSGDLKTRCYIPNCDNSNSTYQENFVHFAIPNQTDEFGVSSPSPCEHYEFIKGEENCVAKAFNKNKTVECTSYVWDKSEFDETVISEFGAVCKKGWKGTTSNTVFMLGVLFGSAGFGMVADKFGRKNVMMTSSLIMLISSIGASFAPNIGLFTFLRFVTAASVSGLFQTGYILAVEFVGTSKRLLCANIMQIVFAVGELILALVASLIRKWKTLELALSIPATILLIYYWLLPESVRWLISKGKHGKAKQTILKAAKWNNVTIPENLLRAAEYSNVETESVERQQSSGPLNLVKTPRLRKWSMNIFFNWIVNALVYYGLSLSVKNLTGNMYKNFAILAAVEIPAVLFATWLLMHCGRRYVLCAVMVFGGIACFCTVFVPQHLSWVVTVLAILGKSAISASFAIIYIYSAEIYPTSLRSTGIGLSSMCGRLGGIIAPVISDMRKIYHPLPMIIFGIASIISGLLALALPETHNKQLPETIEETQDLGFRSGGYERLLSRPRNLPQIGTSPRIVRRLQDEARKLIIA